MEQEKTCKIPPKKLAQTFKKWNTNMSNTKNTTSSTALVFAGQGAQYTGMGKELYYSSKVAKQVFDELESIRKGTIDQCFSAPKEELSLTINTQPCVFAVSYAHAMALKSNGLSPKAIAGFSLGEVAALTCAGVLTLKDGFRAVIKRAEFMHDCTNKHKGTMSAVLRLEQLAVEELAKKHGVYPVNYNCPGQIVVSGELDKMQEFNASVNSSGGRAMLLPVSGAFHSPLMAAASDNFAKHLGTLKLSKPNLPVYSNVTAKEYPTDTIKIKELFANQIKSPVQWISTIKNMTKDYKIDTFIETEPGKILTGLNSKILA